MARFQPPPLRPAVAVSGGRDSLALALLAHEWAEARRRPLAAFVVDHGLRSEAAREAGQVAAWLEARGIAARILRWTGDKPASGVQAAARAARYRLLGDACHEIGADALLLGHQLEDQAETHLMRLARGAGLDGLAAMAEDTRRDGLRLLRPLLRAPRARLAATLQARGQPWLDDPSNADPRYERARVRPLIAALGAERLAAAADTARAARDALDRAAADLASRAARLDPGGWAVLDAEEFRRDPAGGRALRLLLHALGGDPYPPAVGRVQALLGELGREAHTLAHCRIVPWRGGVLLCREARGLPPPTPASPGRATRWDRFLLELGPDAPADLEIGAFGQPAAFRWAPAPARASLPWLRRAGAAAFAPPPGEAAEWGARLRFAPRAPLERLGLELPNQPRPLS